MPTMMNVRFKNGRNLGKVEESFAAILSPGDTFFLRWYEPGADQTRHV